MEFTTSIDENWRLRYAAFLCGIFTVLSLSSMRVFPNLLNLRRNLKSQRSAVIAKVIQSSAVSFLNLQNFVTHGLR
jgi:hypothetical protein